MLIGRRQDDNDPDLLPPEPNYRRHTQRKPPPTNPSRDDRAPESEPTAKKPKRAGLEEEDADDSASPAERHPRSTMAPAPENGKCLLDSWLLSQPEGNNDAVPSGGEIVQPKDFKAPTPPADALAPHAPDLDAPDLDAATDSMYGQTASVSSKNVTSTAMFRGRQKAHGVLHDERGQKMPPEVRRIVNSYILKDREGSPPQNEVEADRMQSRCD